MFDGNGNWVSEFSAQSDRDNGIAILASRFDNVFIADIKESFENCLTKDGQIGFSGNFNMNSYKIFNLKDGINANDAVNKGQLDSMYPVGSIYIGTQAKCPLEDIISGSAWELVAEKIVLEVEKTAGVKGNGKAIGLFNGKNTAMMTQSGNGTGALNASRGLAFGNSVDVKNAGDNDGSYSGVTDSKAVGLSPDADKSGIVADIVSSELSLNIWKRTA